MDEEEKNDGREPMISWHMDKIEALDKVFYATMILIAEAREKLVDAADEVLDSVNVCEFRKAIRLGTRQVSDAFISLQRHLGELEKLIQQKDNLVQEIYDEMFDGDKIFIKKEIRELIEEQMSACSSRERFRYLHIQLGEHTLTRLEELQSVRKFPLDKIVEAIIANVMRNDKAFEALKEDNRGKAPYVDAEQECFIGLKFQENLRALEEQERRRLGRLY